MEKEDFWAMGMEELIDPGIRGYGEEDGVDAGV